MSVGPYLQTFTNVMS